WDCKTSIRLPSLLLLGDFHPAKRLGVAATALLATLASYLPDVMGDFLRLGQLTAVTEQRLDFEFKGLGDIDIRIGVFGATEVDLTYLVGWQPGIGLWYVAGVPGGWIERVKYR